MSNKTKIDDGGPAFPLPITDLSTTPYPGMSLHDWFAGMALQGMIASSANPNAMGYPDFGEAAKLAYEQADAMIKQRGKTNA